MKYLLTLQYPGGPNLVNGQKIRWPFTNGSLTIRWPRNNMNKKSTKDI